MTGMGVLLVAEGAHEEARAQHFEAQDERANALGYATTFTQLGLAHLVVGVPVLTAGVIVRRRVFVPNRALNVTFVPILSANRVGGVFALRF